MHISSSHSTVQDAKSTDDSLPSNYDNSDDINQAKEDERNSDLLTRFLRSYSSILVRYPSITVSFTIAAVVFSFVMGVVQKAGAKPYIDTGDPLKGIEARGTTLSSRNMALHNLRRYVHPSSSTVRKSILSRRNLQLSGKPYHLENYMEGLMIIYKHKNKENLFPHMAGLCKWYKQKVEKLSNYSNYVRLVHHIPNYIAKLNNKTDCELITTDDTNIFVSLLNNCVGYYTNYTFLNCKKNKTICKYISDPCRVHQYIPDQQIMASIYFNTFHFLAGRSLKRNPRFLEMTSIVAVLKKIDNVEEQLFDPLYRNQLSDINEAKFDGVKVVAYTMWGFKHYLFEQELFLQCFYVVIAIIIVILLTWFYSGSIFIGFTTFACILFAVVISYFVYGRVYDINFFPFVNINTLIFIIGIGADDVFIYTQVWKVAKQTYKIQNTDQHIEYLIKWTTFTLRHAILAMLVTSLTTAVSFFSNIATGVATVKCFGLFAGTAIIVNYILMFTYLPCAVILHERYLSKCMHHCFPSLCQKHPSITETDKGDGFRTNVNKGIIRRCEGLLTNFSGIVFTNFLPYIVCKLKFFFVIILLLLGIGGIIVTFVNPGLNPPTVSVAQLFTHSSPLEKYYLYYKHEFDYGYKGVQYPHEIYFVFGVTPVDNGNKFDPGDTGTLQLKKTLNITDVQTWLRPFCKNVTAAHFYSDSKSCSQLEDIFHRLTLPCTNTSKICCAKSSFPITNKEFLSCFKQFVEQDMTKNITGIDPAFDKKDGSLQALVLPVTTKYVYRMSFDYNKKITENLEEWTNDQMKHAPDTLKGWWSGAFQLFDLQDSLYKGTTVSIGIAVASAFTVILFTSCNFILSIYSIITIAFVICMTVGTLVLQGWYLDILESMIFSLAAGLSADFTLHYSVAYRTFCLIDERDEKVKHALVHVGAPITMGAITTFVGGLAMMPSTILCYEKIGHFLMVVMFFSWIYSTLFFLPLCAAIGPTGIWGELRCSRYKRNQVADVAVT